MAREGEFSPGTKMQALERQQHRCASCGTKINNLGNVARSTHKYGESTHAHHLKHVQQGGGSSVGNCVILCESCHYSVHEGGQYRSRDIIATPTDFPYFWGSSR
jgi:5-methylcytosine-specific restriction endonuclease McrA